MWVSAFQVVTYTTELVNGHGDDGGDSNRDTDT
jgi:hypothetical protein